MAQSPEDVIVDLWAAVFGEPPPVRAELSMMVGALVSGLPEPDRLCDPHARSTLAAPKA